MPLVLDSLVLDSPVLDSLVLGLVLMVHRGEEKAKMDLEMEMVMLTSMVVTMVVVAVIDAEEIIPDLDLDPDHLIDPIDLEGAKD